MKKYVFRLQKVLKTKKIKQDIEQRKLMEREQHLTEEKLHLQALKEREQNFLEEFKQKRLTTLPGHVFHKYTSYQKQVEKYLEQQNASVDKATEIVAQQRSELIRAAKETNMIDKLKEKDYNRFLRERKTKEQKQIDELSLMKPLRKKSGLYND